jgi:hypothetical protein
VAEGRFDADRPPADGPDTRNSERTFRTQFSGFITLNTGIPAMPSRRTVLAGASVLALAGVGGDVAWSQSVGTGRLYHKSVSVVDERNGRRYGFDVATLLYADSSRRVIGEFVEEFADAYDPPAALRIGPELHERLTETFDEVGYLLTFEANGRIGGRVPRSDFDRVGLGDEVEVLAYDWLDADANNRVVRVTPNDPVVAERDVTTHPLAEASPE